MSRAQTEAGRQLLELWRSGRTHPPSAQRLRDFVDLVIAIEAEAAAAARAEVARQVREYQRRKASEYVGHPVRVFDAVLALLDAAPREEPKP